ncbi:hypothetical protein CONPUDRAFT_144312 [Coniophora puteana RWD-64-598 SS2]|uniref:Uncharacterized protein n=1 Tax=Coniophora puteana (strain RWD-64-598) TaxID=741705 RepID=A0A5M3MR07_CONPW|nr:uncharacterized protein CONPUDRAFT_144312 [Coniophora puteana RWD-64-598 SS2]EIW81613.1 hypothetical protein CONPUDRAFT_144312 [Coniophora puteana RWD-64-598 SS2]
MAHPTPVIDSNAAHGALSVAALSDALRAKLQTRVETTLYETICKNSTSKFARASNALSTFRDSCPTPSSLENRQTTLTSFRSTVPLTSYPAYEPYIAPLLRSPCSVSSAADALSPGIPTFIGISSSTSGGTSKFFPRYSRTIEEMSDLLGRRHPFAGTGYTSWMMGLGVKDVVEVYVGGGDDSGEAKARVPICNVSTGQTRVGLQLDLDGEKERMAVTYECSDIALFPMHLTDDQEEWETLLYALEKGTYPGWQGTERVRRYLENKIIADSSRAEELRTLGPPSAVEMWASRAWPKLDLVIGICSGTFSRSIPQLRSYLSPHVVLRNPVYASTECLLGITYDDSMLSVFKIMLDDVIEFLPVIPSEGDLDILNSWEVEVGKLYEPVVTTRDLRATGSGATGWVTPSRSSGLRPATAHRWSSTQGDAKTSADNPLQSHSASLRLSHALLSEEDIITSLACVEELNGCEFTTWLDDRPLPPTVGYIIEVNAKIADTISPSMRDQLAHALCASNENFAVGYSKTISSRPTIRLVSRGTFAEFRRWKGERLGSGSGQIKVPVVMGENQGETREVLLTRVVREL